MLKRLFKSTFLFAFIGILSCGNQNKKEQTSEEIALNNKKQPAVAEIILAANRTESYLPLLENKKVGEVRSGRNDRALALMRLEHLQHIDATFTADGAAVAPKKPEWAEF